MALRPSPRRHDTAPVNGPVVDDCQETRTTIVCDDSAAYRSGIRTHLGAEFGKVLEAASLAELARLCEERRPDLVVIGDALFAEPDEALACIPLGTRFVVLAFTASTEDVVAALDAGAAGYLLRSTPATQFRAALRAVVEGDEPPLPIPAEVLAVGRARAARRSRTVSLADGQTVALTAREREVAMRLTLGQSTRAIAEELQISTVTVRRHISVLMDKVGASDRASVVKALVA